MDSQKEYLEIINRTIMMSIFIKYVLYIIEIEEKKIIEVLSISIINTGNV